MRDALLRVRTIAPSLANLERNRLAPEREAIASSSVRSHATDSALERLQAVAAEDVLVQEAGLVENPGVAGDIDGEHLP
jgi:hypothetical protein